MANQITLQNGQYEFIDSLEYISMADSFVKNKIGTGHGEAKLYVGQGQRMINFFEDYQFECFFVKNDLIKYMEDAKNEFQTPEQNYIKKDEMPKIFNQNKAALEAIKDDMIRFNIYKVDVEPPRIYINSESDNYTIMREIGLPNISYLSIMKIKIGNTKKLYFRLFIDYTDNSDNYEVNEQKEIIENKNISEKQKMTLIKARIGQGDYREKLLAEMPICPFTGVVDERLLIASHIKPWAKSDNREKVDPKNGLIFTPTYDKLFDRGFISFEDNGELMVSPWISPLNQKRLGIFNKKKLFLPLEGRREYLAYHRENIFKA